MKTGSSLVRASRRQTDSLSTRKGAASNLRIECIPLSNPPLLFLVKRQLLRSLGHRPGPLRMAWKGSCAGRIVTSVVERLLNALFIQNTDHTLNMHEHPPT